MKVLVVEDDPAIADALRMGLEAEGYKVHLESDGAKAVKMNALVQPDILIVDIMLPGTNGLALVQELRRRLVTTPILMLTARGGLNDRVIGLDAGADDYLSKPFAFPELSARLRALLRREAAHKGKVIQIADLVIDTINQRVSRAGKDISLTPREYSLLEALARNLGRNLHRETIQFSVWMDDESYSNTVDVCVSSLRKKIDSGHEIQLIHTAHRQGYSLRAPGGS